MATIGIVMVWRCPCGIPIKVVAETARNQPRASRLAVCPKCGAKQIVEAERIISVAEDVSDLRPTRDNDRP